MANDQTTADMVFAAELARRKAVETVDKKVLERLLMDDFTYVHGSGRIEDKHAYIKGLGAGVNRYTDYAAKDVLVRIKGEAALVFGEFLATGQTVRAPVVPVASRFRFSALWFLVNDAWRLSYYQHTKFKAPN